MLGLGSTTATASSFLAVVPFLVIPDGPGLGLPEVGGPPGLGLMGPLGPVGDFPGFWVGGGLLVFVVVLVASLF